MAPLLVLGLLMAISLGKLAMDATHVSGTSASALAQTTGRPVNDPNGVGGSEVDEAVCPGEGVVEVSDTGRCSHGGDPVPASAERVVGAAGAAPPIDCDGDGVSGNRIQVLYVRPSNTASQASRVRPQLRGIAQYANQIYRDSAAETGGSRSIRFVHDADCRITVTEVVLSTTGDDYFGNTTSELYAKGFDDTNRKYMIFMDADFYCGIGDYYEDDSKGTGNYNNFGPSYGRIDRSCWSYPEVAAHELMHTLGAVMPSAPHATNLGHCFDEWEVMCYDDDYETSTFPLVERCPEFARDATLFDCNHDDYFHTNPSSGSYLGTHWNAANNRFLIGAGTTGPPPGMLTLDKDKSKYNGGVYATVTGLKPNTAVTLRWPRAYEITSGPNDGQFTTALATATTDGSGRATFSFRTPLEPYGDYDVTARDPSGGRAVATLRVIPRILLNETAGPASSNLRVYFYGFAPNERIEVQWHANGSASSTYTVLKTLTVAGNGRASSLVTIPSSTGTGAHLLVGKVVGVSRSASTPFTVTAGGGSVDDGTATATTLPTATPEATTTQESTATDTATPEAPPTETPTQEPITTAEPTVTTTPIPTETPVPAQNASPVAAAGGDQALVDADGSGDEPVDLDGGSSIDPEGGMLTYAWSVDGAEIAIGVDPTVTLPVGTTTITLTVTDEQGANAADDALVTVEAAPKPPPVEGEEG